MKVLAIAVLSIAAATYAQAPRQPQPPPHAVPGAGAPQAVPPAQPPAAGTSVEPKHSESTATLRAIEAEKSTLLAQQQSLANQVNTLMAGLRDKITQKESDAKAEEDAIRKENEWGDDVQYVPPQQLPDGSTAPGKWMKTPKK